ncbi:hypothetical protein BD324DRAFT_627210 [Kockovaella imperatae]|uniref:Uncharacterized protein n=1 Tax=Kockovaella imperatae TaxID=4999 RepID=A0A1Y1UFJ7_9TREE|nr:hypothetical protein BD324DRAFT_627210 [Kockovaella imperatae]ORX36802.1 hypothetical protein BD324DRAFT_627210 [Kockovaella imperatae]
MSSAVAVAAAATAVAVFSFLKDTIDIIISRHRIPPIQYYYYSIHLSILVALIIIV